jgi:hypothetical protein
LPAQHARCQQTRSTELARRAATSALPSSLDSSEVGESISSQNHLIPRRDLPGIFWQSSRISGCIRFLIVAQVVYCAWRQTHRVDKDTAACKFFQLEYFATS